MARQPFNTRWAQGVETQSNANTFQVPPGPRLTSGWEGGQDKDAPPAGQENWWHNRVDSALQDLERQGAMTWHAQAIYGLGAPCYATDGYYYESQDAGNVGNSPLSSSVYWRQIGQSLYSTFSVGEYKDVAHNGSPDSGWLKSTGAVLLRTAYPKLFAVIGTTYNTGGELSTQFRLPDWRGVFTRCLDDGRGVDTGRALGNALQASQNLSHAHSASSAGAGGHSHAASATASASADAQGQHSHTSPKGNTGGGTAVQNGPPAAGTVSTDAAGLHSHNISVSVGVTVAGVGDHAHTISIGSNGGSEARPVNLAQVRWIRYL